MVLSQKEDPPSIHDLVLKAARGQVSAPTGLALVSGFQPSLGSKARSRPFGNSAATDSTNVLGTYCVPDTHARLTPLSPHNDTDLGITSPVFWMGTLKRSQTGPESCRSQRTEPSFRPGPSDAVADANPLHAHGHVPNLLPRPAPTWVFSCLIYRVFTPQTVLRNGRQVPGAPSPTLGGEGSRCVGSSPLFQVWCLQCQHHLRGA